MVYSFFFTYASASRTRARLACACRRRPPPACCRRPGLLVKSSPPSPSPWTPPPPEFVFSLFYCSRLQMYNTPPPDSTSGRFPPTVDLVPRSGRRHRNRRRPSKLAGHPSLVFGGGSEGITEEEGVRWSGCSCSGGAAGRKRCCRRRCRWCSVEEENVADEGGRRCS
jgi:hypothetical protein